MLLTRLANAAIAIIEMLPKLAGEDLTNDVIKNEQRMNYTNITASTLIKTGSGRFFGFVVNSNTAGSVKAWDNTSAATTTILNTFTPTTATSGIFTFGGGIEFTTGLYITIAGTADVTILWK